MKDNVARVKCPSLTCNKLLDPLSYKELVTFLGKSYVSKTDVRFVCTSNMGMLSLDGLNNLWILTVKTCSAKLLDKRSYKNRQRNYDYQLVWPSLRSESARVWKDVIGPEENARAWSSMSVEGRRLVICWMPRLQELVLPSGGGRKSERRVVYETCGQDEVDQAP